MAISAATPPVLTARQARVLALLDQQPQPSLRDIAEAMTGNRGNVNGARQYLAALERKGFIRRDKDSHGGHTCGSKAARIVRRNDGPRILVAGHWFEWQAEPGPDASMPQVK